MIGFFFGDEGQGWPWSDPDWPFWPGTGPGPAQTDPWTVYQQLHIISL